MKKTLIITIVVLIATKAIATNYYVSETGNDGNDGLTIANAWASIDNGNGSLNPGDTVHVLPGIYSASLNIIDNGEPSNYIVFAGVQDSCLVDGGGQATAVTIDADYILWSGIDISGASDHNLEVSGEYNIIDRCKISDADKYGIEFHSPNNIVKWCVFVNNQLAGVNAGGDNTQIIHCTFYNSGTMAIDALESQNNTITNCIFLGFEQANVAVRATDETELSYSSIFNHNTPVQGGVELGAGMIEIDPLLIEPDSGNYRLSSQSPGLDAGIDVGMTYIGTAPDMGAYEAGLPASLTITPVYDSLFADSVYQFSAIAVDNNGNPANAGELTWSHTFASGVIDMTGLFTPILVESGRIIVSSSLEGIVDTSAVLDVVPGTLDSLYITPYRDTISSDSTRQFSVNGFDIKGNTVSELGEVSWDVKKNIGSIDSTGLFVPSETGAGFIQAYSSLKIETITDTIFVVGGEITSIEVLPSSNTMEVDSSYQYTADGFDADENQISDLTSSVVWSTTDPAGSVSAGGLYTAGNVPSSPLYYVKAIYNGVLIDSSEVTVTASTLSYIVIEIEGGDSFGDTTLTTDNDSTLFFCRGYDSGDALIGNTSVTWSIIGEDGIGTVIAGPDAQTSLTLSALGTGKVVATYSAGIVDTTGTITSEAGTADSLAISPDSDTINAGSTLQFNVVSRDADGNLTNPQITPAWEVLGGIGSINASGLLTSSTAGTGYIVATGGGLVDTSGQINITSGTLVQIDINPNTTSVRIGNSIQFTAEGQDADSNITSTGNLTWQVLGRIGMIDSNGLFIADLPGVCSVLVTSSINSVMNISGTVTVEALFLSSVPSVIPVINANNNQAPLLTFHIDNYYTENESIASVTIRDASTGDGTPVERLSNIDSIALYCDIDNDSVLTEADSLIAITEFSSLVTTLSFPPLTIETGNARTFFITADISQFPHDGDSLDAFLLSSTDILTSDGTTIDGPDTANSAGFSILDGLVAEQLSLIGSGLVTINPTDSLYNLLTIDIPRNGYATDTLLTFSIENLGTASSSDIDSLILYADNGNGVWGGRTEETLMGNLVFTGSQWTTSGLSKPLVTLTTRFHLAAKLSDYPTGEATVILTIPQNGLEMSSSNDGPLNSSPHPPDTITIQTLEVVTVTTKPLPTLKLIPGVPLQIMTNLDIVNGYPSSTTIDSLTLTMFATDLDGATQNELDSQIDSVFVYLNRDSDPSTISETDTLLVISSVTNGEVPVRTPGLILNGNGGSASLCIGVFLSNLNSKNDNTINIGLNSSSDIHLSHALSVTGTFPTKNLLDHTIYTFPTTAVTVNQLPGTNLYGAQTNQLVLDFELPRNGYDSDQLRRLQLINSGTLDETEALDAVYLYADNSGNGYTMDDPLLGNFTSNGSLWELTGLSYNLTNLRTRLFVVVDVTSQQFTGSNLHFEIPLEGALYWSGTAGPNNGSLGNLETNLVFPSGRVTAISIPTPSQTMSPGSADNAVLTFALYNGYVNQGQSLEGIKLTNVSHSVSNQTFSDYELGLVSIYFDSNQDRILNNDSLIAVGYFLDSSLQLTGLDIQLSAESLSYFFVTANAPLNIIDNDSLAVSIINTSDFVFSQSVVLNGDLPLTSGGYLIGDGSVSDQYQSLPLTVRTLSPGDTSVTLYAFRPALNGDQTDTVQSLIIANLANATASDFSSMALWLDNNGDSTWQSSDLPLGSFSFSAGAWSLNGLTVISTPMAQPTLFVIADIAASATPDVTFQGAIPINGCQFASTNDGPVDQALIGAETFLISNSGLRLSSTTLNQTYSLGQTIEIKITATNITASTIDSVSGLIVGISDSAVVSIDSISAEPINLAPGDSTQFSFYYTATAIGTVSWQHQAVTPIIPNALAIIQTNTVTIQAAPLSVITQLVNSIPTAVTKGRTDVFPMAIKIKHPDTLATTASLRLDSIRINVEDGNGSPLLANKVFSQMVLANGYAVLSVVDLIPAASSISLIFSEPVIIAPSQEQSFSLRVNIDNLATAENFALSINDANAIFLIDENTLTPVPIDTSVIFPLRTASCRVEEPSREGAISSLSILGQTVNYGQQDVETVQLKLFHPGAAGSSQIQLTDISFELVDNLGIAFTASELVSNVKVMRQQVLAGQMTGVELNTKLIRMQLASPMTLNAGESDYLKIIVSVKNESVHPGFRLKIKDSTSLVLRDLGSGSLLTTITDTLVYTTGLAFPILSNWATLKQSAEPLQICPESTLPYSVVGGTDSLVLMEYTMQYPVSDNYSSVRLNDYRLLILDSIGTPLDPNRLFDRLGYRVNNGSISYQPFIQLLDGAMIITTTDTDLIVAPGDSLVVQLIGDIEPDVPFDHFILQASTSNAITLQDATDTTSSPGFSLNSGCSSNWPFVTNATQIFISAGQPTISQTSLPVQMAFTGQNELPLWIGNFDYETAGMQGDLAIAGMYGRVFNRSTAGLTSVPTAEIFRAIRIYINDSLVGIDTLLNNDSVSISFDTDYFVSTGTSVPIKLTADIDSTVAQGNYVIRFNDSLFMDIYDRNLLSPVFPLLDNISYPLSTAEMSVSSASLENSFTNYPNPFNTSLGQSTSIGFILTEDAQVDIKLFSITGNEVKVIIRDSFRPAYMPQTENWAGINGKGQPVVPGTYFCLITARYVSGRVENFRRKIAVIR